LPSNAVDVMPQVQMAVVNVVPSKPLPKSSPLRSGMRTDATGKPVRNVILFSLPDREFQLLRSHLEPVELPHHRGVHGILPMTPDSDAGPS
jgi:hypothetical protein